MNTDNSPELVDKKKLAERNMRNAMYFIGISTVVGITAGVVSAKIAKKKGNEYYKDAKIESKVIRENPTHLAFRALAWSAFYSIGFTSLAVFAFCKWFNISSMEDLRTTVRKYSRKNQKSEGRTEFESFSDFLNYLNDPSHSK